MPMVMASVKASATRASVTPMLKNSAPDSASVITTCITAGGAGSLVLPASSAAIHHVARKIRNDKRRSTSISAKRVIIGARVEVRCRSHELRAADAGQHVVEHARILLLVLDPAMRNAFAVAVAIGMQGRGIARAGQLGNVVPGAIRGRQDLLGLARHLDEPRELVLVGIGPCLVEDVADHG